MADGREGGAAAVPVVKEKAGRMVVEDVLVRRDRVGMGAEIMRLKNRPRRANAGEDRLGEDYLIALSRREVGDGVDIGGRIEGRVEVELVGAARPSGPRATADL